MADSVKREKEKRENAASSLFVVILTSVSAPLLAHLLDLILGAQSNPWKSDRLIILYFAAVAGYVIANKIIRSIKKTRAYEKGLKLGSSDAFQNIVWAFPALLVIYCYDYIPGIVIDLVIFIAAGVILFCDGDQISSIVPALCLSGIFAMLFAALSFMLPTEWSPSQWLIYLVRLIISQTVVCLAFDGLAILVKKRDNRKQKKEENLVSSQETGNTKQ